MTVSVYRIFYYDRVNLQVKSKYYEGTSENFAKEAFLNANKRVPADAIICINEKNQTSENTEYKQLDIKEIRSKAKGIRYIENVMNVLSLEETIAYLNDGTIKSANFRPGDECLIADILRTLSGKGHSVRHSLEILDMAKDFLLSISQTQA